MYLYINTGPNYEYKNFIGTYNIHSRYRKVVIIIDIFKVERVGLINKYLNGLCNTDEGLP